MENQLVLRGLLHPEDVRQLIGWVSLARLFTN
jgi:hypothetical protein